MRRVLAGLSGDAVYGKCKEDKESEIERAAQRDEGDRRGHMVKCNTAKLDV